MTLWLLTGLLFVLVSNNVEAHATKFLSCKSKHSSLVSFHVTIWYATVSLIIYLLFIYSQFLSIEDACQVPRVHLDIQIYEGFQKT